MGENGRTQTPVVIVLVCVILVLYGLLWALTWLLAGTSGNESVALVSLVVAVSVLLLASFLYLGSRTAWWVAVAFVGGSTVWRLSLVAGGNPDNLSNVVVGLLLLVGLLSQYEYYRPAGS